MGGVLLETIFCTLYLTRCRTYKIDRPPQTKTQEARGPQTDKHLPQSAFIGHNFLDDDILLWCLYSSLIYVNMVKRWLGKAYIKRCMISNLLLTVRYLE